ncbi:MAG: hypothetical protein FWD05_10415 [Oscillospiraceae bacterium]|nr:hypothetical protein [Oscillospiraceae bacterium]
MFLVQAGLFVAAIYLFVLTQEAEVTTYIGNYTGLLGITLRADELSAIFVMLTVFIFLMVMLYSFREQKSRLYWFLIFIMEGALMGLFLTRDLFNIFVLTEVASVVAAILLMYNRNNRSMYDGMVYLMVNVIVMQLFLFGVGYIYMLTGLLDLAYSGHAMAYLERSQLVLPFALIMTAVAAKCGLLPIFTFLPKVHSIPKAPATVAAILSGLQVKVGLYLFLRFQSMFSVIDVDNFFIIIGVMTAIFGIVLAVSQTSFKRILAYSTIAQVGLILVGLSVNQPYSYIGSVYHMVGHAVAKAGLFLSAGILIESCGTGNVTKIRGVFRRMPLVGVGISLAILGITGAPFFSGNISKYFMMANVNPLLFVLMTIINLGTIVIFIRCAKMLFGRPTDDNTVRVDMCKQISVLMIGILCLVGGIWGLDSIYILFGRELSISVWSFVEKTLIVLASWGVGILLVSKVLPRYQTKLDVLVRFDLNFRTICASIGGMFALLLIVVGFLI